MYSFEQHYGIYESAPIGLDQINNLKDDKLFVTVGGGIGAGKTFLTKKFVELPIIDVDDHITEVGGGKYDRANLGQGRKAFEGALDKALEGDESFIHMGTNANLNTTKKRLQKAKENGFTTILVLIDTKPEKAAEQIKGREDRDEIAMERIVQSHDDALNVFETLKKDNNIVDFFVYNKR